MRPFRTEDVSTQEWRWVAYLGGFLVALTLLPYAWAMFVSDNAWSFMGALANPQDSATYFAKIRQGMEGNWLFDLQYTPESHDRAGFFLFYLLLGHIARLLGFSTVIIFHLARVATSFFMFTALYQLGAYVWQRLRPRRLFLALTAMGSGLGWLIIIFYQNPNRVPPDLNIPEGFPLYAAYANPHFPLAIGCMALLAGICLQVFRPGFKETPNMDNGGLSVIVYSIILAIIQPPALMSIAGALIVFILINAYTLRQIPWHEVRWTAMICLPAFPIALYYVLVFQTNEIFGQFNEQNQTPSPFIPITILTYALLLTAAMPGIIRAARRFERDGDQFMLIWLIVGAIALYLPYPLQRRFFIGLIIPIGFFIVRSLEDYWFDQIRTRWHKLTLILLFVFMLPSNIIALGIPLFGAVANREEGAELGILVDRNYAEIYDWLEEFGTEGEVVLASDEISLWIPARTPLRVVYGHQFETVPSKERQEQVGDFFSGRDCETLLSDEEINFRVSYVIWGDREDTLAEEIHEDNPDETFADCREMIESFVEDEQQIREFGDVTLYILRGLR